MAATDGQAEVASARPFVERYLPALLAQAAHLLVGDFADEIRAHGLSVLEWRVLATLTDSPPIAVGMLARRAVTKQPTLTRLLDRLVQQGLVFRIAAPTDRRQTLIGITKEGQRVVTGLIERADSRQRALLGASGNSQQWLVLENLLRQLIEQLDAPAPPAPPQSARSRRPKVISPHLTYQVPNVGERTNKGSLKTA